MTIFPLMLAMWFADAYIVNDLADHAGYWRWVFDTCQFCDSSPEKPR
jgi:hypothetical protein